MRFQLLLYTFFVLNLALIKPVFAQNFILISDIDDTVKITGIKAFGAVAPIGGTLMIIGWALLFWGASKS